MIGHPYIHVGVDNYGRAFRDGRNLRVELEILGGGGLWHGPLTPAEARGLAVDLLEAAREIERRQDGLV